MTRHLPGIGMTSQRTRDRLVERLREEGIRNEAVLEAIRQTPRHVFVDEALESRAYEDTALPIGQGQTISQPYIVARMTEALLAGGRLEKVLEIGTGSGYQAAILARLVSKVYSIERNQTLLEQARKRLRVLRLTHVRLRHGDGSEGWPERGPFDGIVVTAAPLDVPDALWDQVAVGGRLVIPIGPPGSQRLVAYHRLPEGFEEIFLDPVSFVPLVGGTH